MTEARCPDRTLLRAYQAGELPRSAAAKLMAHLNARLGEDRVVTLATARHRRGVPQTEERVVLWDVCIDQHIKDGIRPAGPSIR